MKSVAVGASRANAGNLYNENGVIMVILETDRLILRNFNEKDIQDFYEYMKLDYTAKHEDFDPKTYEECVEIVKRRVLQDNCLVVELKENHKVIGDIGFEAGECASYCFSFDFNIAYEKRGYATEACEAVIKHIFLSLKGRRIYAECNDDNVNSYRLLERLNFRREGHFIEDVSFKQNELGEDIFVNSYLYALLKREWQQLHISNG